MTASNQPWSFVAGLAITLIGVGLGVISFQEDNTLRLPIGLAVFWGLIELSGGFSLLKAGVGLAHVVAGALTLAFALLGRGISALPGFELTAEPLMLFIGVACACNAVFRSLDLFIFRPGSPFTETANAVVSFGVAAVALSSWRWATPSLAERLIAVVLVVGGASLVGSAISSRRRGEAVEVSAGAPAIAAV